MAWDIRLIFGVFKVQMKTFFYIYKTWGWIAIWLRKYLGKLEHVLKFSILTPSKIACQMRQNQCIKVLNDINLPKKEKNNSGIQLDNLWVFCYSQTLNNIFLQCYQIIHENLPEVKKNSIFLIFVICITLLRAIRIPNPKLYTPKKTFSSVLWPHQLLAWYLKACQKKVGCQNCKGLPDTL